MRLRSLAGRVWKRLTRRPRYIDLVVVEAGDGLNPFGPPAPGLTVVELDAADLDETIAAAIADVGFYTHSVDEIRSRLRDGERCYVLMDGDQLASFFWVVVGTYREDALKRTLDLGDGAYYLGGLTTDAYRGRAMLPYLAHEAISELGAHGESMFVSAFVRSTNTSSLRMSAKLGFERTGHVRCLEIGAGLRVQWLTQGSRIASLNPRIRVDLAPTWLT